MNYILRLVIKYKVDRQLVKEAILYCRQHPKIDVEDYIKEKIKSDS